MNGYYVLEVLNKLFSYSGLLFVMVFPSCTACMFCLQVISLVAQLSPLSLWACTPCMFCLKASLTSHTSFSNSVGQRDRLMVSCVVAVVLIVCVHMYLLNFSGPLDSSEVESMKFTVALNQRGRKWY